MPTALNKGEIIAGRYRLVRIIGTGNMSTVYEGIDTRGVYGTVAIKLLNTAHADELKQEIFRRETKALEKLEHPNIVKVIEYSWLNEHNCPYIVLEYIPYTLIDAIQQHKKDKDQEWCWPLMRQVTDALIQAHIQGVIHRDIKPTNILITETGIPKLTDFGVSYLKYELGTGVTLSSYWSQGYAAPEHRNNQQATEQSDIYSLGCVFYHLLSKQEPPPNGVTSKQIQALNVPTPLKQILYQMLATQPEERFESALQLRRRLEVTKQYESTPELYFLMTDMVRRELVNQGYIKRSSIEAAQNFLTEELGDDNPKEVHVSLEKNDIHILTDKLRLICTRDQQDPVLIIKAIKTPYQPTLELNKSRSVAFRYLWNFIDRSDLPTLSKTVKKELSTTLDALLEQLSTQNRIVQTTKKRKTEQKDFTKVWNAVLNLQRTQLDQVPKVYYGRFEKQENIVTFQLKDTPPDNLSWSDSAPIAAWSEDKQQRQTFVGFLISVEGKEIQVACDYAGQGNSQSYDQLPSSGFIGVYQQEALAALERQRWALNTLTSGGTPNSRLLEVLQDLSAATFNEIDEDLEFYQQDLAEDKKNAVRQALAANDIFLLQGPPGTGKTTTLAEIILQILKLKPDARILVSSQSNVAVNHVLSRVSELRANQRTEIVRIGRPEKIGQGAEEWTLEQRLDTWRKEVLERTDEVVKKLKEQVNQQKRRRTQNKQLAPQLLDDLKQCKIWLETLESDFGELTKFEQRRDSLQRHLSSETKHPTEQTEKAFSKLREYEANIQNKTDDISSTLALIRSYLPETLQTVSSTSSSLTAERQQLYKMITDILEPQELTSKESNILDLVQRWRKIFGKQDEFARPILERANILAATCLITGGHYLKNHEFDWAIIDEAGRATAPELLVPLVRSRRSIIVGDERQLPPMVDEDLQQDDLTRLNVTRESLEESLFTALVTQGKAERLPAIQMLTEQHRMHPVIGQLISTIFYDGQLKHATNSQDRDHKLPWLSKAVVWFSTTRMPQHYEARHSNSYYNPTEVQGIHQLLLKMERTYQELGETREVAVITPYNAQIAELQERITPHLYWKSLRIEIATVDAFQGRDCDIVLYSTVRSNREAKLGFLKDRRRLNVALSRARQLLIIIGDIWTLENGQTGRDGNPYQELIKYIDETSEDCLLLDLEMDQPHE